MPDNQQDPSKMTDEELAEALGEVNPEVDPKLDAPTPELETPEPEEEEAPEVPEPAPEEPEAPDAPPSRREQLRIQQVLAKMGKSQPGPAPAPSNPLNYEDEIEATPELISRLTEDRKTSNQASFEEGLRKAEAIEWRTMVHIDAPNVAGKYDQLNKDSPDYREDIAQAMDAKYLAAVGFDPETGNVQHPNIRYRDFVEAEVEFATALAEKMTATTRQNITKQVAQTGLRPDGSTPKRLNLNQAPQQMSDEELDAAIAQAIPSR